MSDNTLVSEEWLSQREREIRSNRRILISIWAVNYLAPLFLLLCPYLGMKPDPTALHGYARAMQIAIGLSLATFVTVHYGRRVLKQNAALRIVDEIRLHGAV